MALDRAIRSGNDTGDSIYDARDWFVLQLYQKMKIPHWLNSGFRFTPEVAC